LGAKIAKDRSGEWRRQDLTEFENANSLKHGFPPGVCRGIMAWKRQEETMTDLPKRIEIHEEGPREGFQIEAGPISTADKVRFCEALAETGLHDVQCVSFVDARRVPGMADAVEVAQTIRQRPDVQYTGIALNLRGYERAVQT